MNSPGKVRRSPLLILLLQTLLVMVCAAPSPALPPDDYLGDSAIYAGVPSERPKPNVLLVIDTSRATLSVAAGEAYAPATTYVSPFNFVADYIYTPGQDGQFDAGSQPVKSGATSLTLANVTCTSTYTDADGASRTVDANDILASYGTYSGAGTGKFPNLTGDGACATAPQGQVYATGNYLNYINSTAAAAGGSIIIKHSYTVSEKVKGVWVNVDYVGIFKLIKNITGATAAMEPGKGTDTAIYWATMPTGTVPTYEIVSGSLVPVVDATNVQDGWQVGANYYSEALDPTKTALKTQRQVFYDALVPVIRGSSTSVNFGFLKYNRANQGAVLGAHLAEYGANPQPLIDVLPGMFTTATAPTTSSPTCTKDSTGAWTDCTDLIASGPNRPASEALFDAGWYLRATYPTVQQKVSSALTEQVPTAIDNPCGYNHIIYLTNGLPNQDSSPTVGGLGDRDGDNVGTESDEDSYGAGTHYLDDVAFYLNKQADLNGDGKPGDVTTHVVLAFQNEDELMRNTALDGGGGFYNVFDTNGLTKALLNILSNIVKESDTAFVAPVVPASSTNRTQSSNRVYLGLFKPQSNAAWHGNLKKYKLSPGNELLDIHGNPATNKAGDFIYSQSFWGTGPVSGTTMILGADGNRNLVPDTYTPVLDSLGNPTTADANGGDGGIVDAGGVGGTLLARDLATRNIFTIVGGSKVNLRTVNSSTGVVSYGLTPTQLGFQSTETLKRSQLTDYLYGFNAYGVTYSTEGQSLGKRSWVLGDILHSKPLVRTYRKYTQDYEGVCYNASDPTAPHNSTIVFVGANDGMLHAFNDCDGSELWAFVPPLLWDKLQNLSDGTHEYYVDGAPVSYVYDANQNGNIESGDKVIMVFGLRRGGGHAFLTPSDPRGAYYAFDITDPRNPVYLWGKTSLDSGFGELGETWSQPTMGFLKDGTTAKLAMFVGAGYDNNEDRRWGNTQAFPTSSWSDDSDFTNDTDTSLPTIDGEHNSGAGVTSAGGGSQLNPKGRGIYIVEMGRIIGTQVSLDPLVIDYSLDLSHAGEIIKSFTNATDTTGRMTFSFPTDLSVVDFDGDGFIDRVYAGDTGGQIWRFELKDGNADPGNDNSLWTARVIFSANAGADGTNGRKFFYRPDVGKSGTDALVFIGSGDREHPLNKAVADRLYMIKDKGQTTPVTETNLKNLTDNELQESTDPDVVSGILSELSSASNYGWYVKLENPGEKMLAPPVLFFGEVLF
ncbi:MAG: pilus assembly protein, partial [Desulfuromonadales bacterium]